MEDKRTGKRTGWHKGHGGGVTCDVDTACTIFAIALEHPELLLDALEDMTEEEMLAVRIAARDLNSAVSSFRDGEAPERYSRAAMQERGEGRRLPQITPRSASSVAARPGSTRGHQ